MIRVVFLALLSAIAFTSCARMDKREARYDPHQCPFCTTKPGVCSYCFAAKKCPFCKGAGIRETGTPTIVEENVDKSSYKEKCPYCGGDGACHYCNATGKCWACDGTAKITSWDFYGKYRKMAGSQVPGDSGAATAEAVDSASAGQGAPQ